MPFNTALLASALCVAAAPETPTPEVVPNYFPVSVGATWVYQSSLGPGAEKVVRVTAVEAKGTDTLVTVDEEYKTGLEGVPNLDVPKLPKTLFRMKVSADGVYNLGPGHGTWAPPECQLKLPHKPGDEWEWRMKGADTFSKEYKAFEAEEVKVPAGSFKALRVDSTLITKKSRTGWTYWYAPNVGVVKINFKGPTGGTQTYALKSYTPGQQVNAK